MKCPNCGKKNRRIARFCQHCGTSLEAAGSPEEEVDLVEETPAAGDLSTTESQATDEALVIPDECSPQLPEMGTDETTAESDAAPEGTSELQMPEPATPEDEKGEEWRSVPAEWAQETAKPTAESPELEMAEPKEIEDVSSAIPGTPLAEAEPAQEELEPEQQASEPATAHVPFEAVPEAPSVDIGTLEDLSTEQEAPDAEVPVEESLKVESQIEAPVSDLHAEAEFLERREPVLPEWMQGEPSLVGDPATEVQELVDAGLLPWSDKPEPITALELGTVVNGRYQITEVLSQKAQEVLYQVRDLQQCPRCGSVDNSPDEAFCASCGAAMDQKPVATMLERPIEQSEGAIDAHIQDHFADGDKNYWVWSEVKQTGPLGGAETLMKPIVGLKSDTGQVRELDEDSLLVLTMSCTYESITDQLGLFVVADGMGGHEAGELASQIAIQALSESLLRNVFIPELGGDALVPEAIQNWMVKAMEAANDQVYLERQKRENDMGTTVTAAFIKNWTLYLAHVGDCRAYRWSEEGLQQLTTDHSIVAGMIAAGTARPEDIYTHPQRSVIYRCVGDRPTVETDIVALSLSPGDRLVLCCDGLWEMIRDEGIEDVMLRESDPQTACDIMVDQANLAGGVDNISVIVVQL